MGDAPIITTQRMTLTGHRADDLDALAAMWADERVYAMIGGQPRSREEVWIRLLRSIGTWTLFGYGAWVLRDRDAGTILGEIGLMEARRVIDPPLDAPELGWTLTGAAQGRGFAHEALVAILDWADGHRIARTQCIIDPGNAPSIRLAEHVGYRWTDERTYHDRPIGVYERIAA
jgi:RimJ/RimL family protein N-acetyltransferase